jgi:hypothetical protein
MWNLKTQHHHNAVMSKWQLPDVEVLLPIFAAAFACRCTTLQLRLPAVAVAIAQRPSPAIPCLCNCHRPPSQLLSPFVAVIRPP